MDISFQLLQYIDLKTQQKMWSCGTLAIYADINELIRYAPNQYLKYFSLIIMAEKQW